MRISVVYWILWFWSTIIILDIYGSSGYVLWSGYGGIDLNCIYTWSECDGIDLNGIYTWSEYNGIDINCI